MAVLTANELKRHCVSGIEQYNLFREYELDKAIAEAEACLTKGEASKIKDLDNFADQLRTEIKQPTPKLHL